MAEVQGERYYLIAHNLWINFSFCIAGLRPCTADAVASQMHNGKATVKMLPHFEPVQSTGRVACQNYPM